MSDFFVENTWTCTSCQGLNLGRDMKCNACGAPKAADAPEQLGTPESTEVTDPKLIALAQQGANWVCEYCGGQVRDGNGKCASCAGPRPAPPVARQSKPSLPPPPVAGEPPPVDPDEEPDVTVRVLETAQESYPQMLEASAKTRHDFLAQQRMSREEPETPKLTPWLAIILGALGFTALVALTLWLCVPRVRVAHVESMTWVYAAELQERTVVHTEGWGSRGDAFNVSCQSKYYGEEDCHMHNCNPHRVAYDCNCTTYQCNCHQVCTNQQNGFSKCSDSCSSCTRCASCYRMEYDTCYDQCPVYRQWCAYDYFAWLTLKVQKTSGTGQETYWADVPVRLEDQRLVKHEEYAVYFVDGADRWSYIPQTLEEYRFFYPTAVWKLKVNQAGGVWPQKEVTNK